MTNPEPNHYSDEMNDYGLPAPETQGVEVDSMMNSHLIDAEFDQGMNAYATGDYKAAKTIFTQLAKLQPDRSMLFLNLGNACFQLNQEEEAIVFWQKTLELDPLEASAYLNIGNVYFGLKNYHQATYYWEQFTSLNRNNANAWLNLGIAYDHLKRPIEAMEAYSLFLGLKHGTPEAVKLQARFTESKRVYEHNTAVAEELLEKGQGVKALNIFIKAMEKYPASAKHYKLVGGLLYKKGELDHAEHYYEMSLRQIPEDSTALTNLGVIYEKKYRFTDAIWAYSKALQHNPKDPNSLKHRLSKLLQQHAHDFNNYLNEAKNYHQQYRGKTALKLIDRLYLLLPSIEKHAPNLVTEVKEWHERIHESCNPSLKAAKCYYIQGVEAHQSGKFDQAMRLYNKYLSLDGKSARANDVRKRLSEIQSTMGAAVQALLNSD